MTVAPRRMPGERVAPAAAAHVEQAVAGLEAEAVEVDRQHRRRGSRSSSRAYQFSIMPSAERRQVKRSSTRCAAGLADAGPQLGVVEHPADGDGQRRRVVRRAP